MRSDYAVTADGGDYTVHVVIGVDPEGRMYVLDLWRRQASSDAWIEAFCDLWTMRTVIPNCQHALIEGTNPRLRKRHDSIADLAPLESMSRVA